ncbi:MAG: phospholipase D-like domain-containing protein [Anaerolineales bacterium]|nr:phospholipase D-like domain-containing protein [Anaerolineales bacterium]MCX7754937.1 phospholipase D-like domain-containing protein [Anaerolineales bacterium]MDW8277314.1 phospholipase D-like domain-containing protein [Anaerolineales bacterium]
MSRSRKKTGNPKGMLIVLAIVLALGLIFVFTGADPLGLFTEAVTVTPAAPAALTDTPLRPPTSTPRDAGGVTPAPSGSDWYEVGFVKPVNLSEAKKNEYSANGLPPELLAGSLAERLIFYIDSAQTSIHVAAFEIDLTDVSNALIRAHKRGVEVRFITDDEFGLGADKKPGHGQLAAMKKAGIEIRDDARNGLMHNKFWIFDGAVVWTGSTNATINGMFEQNNNVIVIKSPALAAIYERQFADMWDGQFGARSPSTIEQQQLTINGTPIQVAFSPEDKPVQFIVSYLQKAQRNIRFMAFSYTQPDMGNAMIERIKSGITVEGVFETVGSDSEFSEMLPLYCAGGKMRRDGNSGFLHHKVIIIDDRIVVTGSLNFSDGANRNNNENILIIENAEIAKRYLEEFQRVWQAASDLDPARFKCP